MELMDVQPHNIRQDLNKLHILCGEMMVGRSTIHQLFDNLMTINAEFEAHHLENKLSQEDIDQFITFLHETYTCVEKYVNKNIVYRIISIKKMKEEMEKLNKDIYMFCKRLNFQMFTEMEVCEKQWYATMEQHCLNDSLYFQSVIISSSSIGDYNDNKL